MKPMLSASDTARDFAKSVVSGDDNGIYYAIGATSTMRNDPATAPYADALMSDYLDMVAANGIESGLDELQYNLASYAVSLDNAIVDYAGLDDDQKQRLRVNRELGEELPTDRLVRRFYFD